MLIAKPRSVFFGAVPSAIVLALFASACGGADDVDFPGTSQATSASSSASSSSTGSPAGGGEAGSGGQGGVGAAGGAGGGEAGAGGEGGSPVTCGDGVAEPPEDCDAMDLGGKTCADYGFSDPSGLLCTGRCKANTSGCAPTCDGVLLEKGEECDGPNLGGHDCTDLGYTNPVGATCVACTPSYDACAPTCGDDVLEPGETCDGAALGGATCALFGFVSPDGLACAADCNGFDPSGCVATCNGTLEPGEECDGANLAGHDCTEFGFATPDGLSCTACLLDPSTCKGSCGNGAIESGEQCDDGNVNPNDGCSATCTLEGIDCASAYMVTLPLGTTTLSGTTVGGGLHSSALCESGGPDRIYAVTLAQAGFFTVSLKRGAPGGKATNFDSVLYVRTQCASNTITCADSTNGAVVGLVGGELVSVRGNAQQTFWVYVDGRTGQAGDYELVLDLSTGTDCTDPVPIPLEPGSGMRVFGSTPLTGNDNSSACGGASSADVVYAVTSSVNGNVGVKIDQAQTFFDTVLYAETDCGGMDLVCQNSGGNGGEAISYPTTIGVPTHVWLDGAFGAQGTYQAVFTPP